MSNPMRADLPTSTRGLRTHAQEVLVNLALIIQVRVGSALHFKFCLHGVTFERGYKIMSCTPDKNK